MSGFIGGGATGGGGGTPGGSNNSIQYNNGGAFGGLGPLTDGQVLIGQTGSAASPALLTPGSGITITNAPGSITIGAQGMPPTTQVEINQATSGDTTIVTASVGKVVSIYRCSLTIGGATTMTWKTAATNLRYDFAGPGAIVLDGTNTPWFATNTSAAFVLNSSNAVQISGEIDYTQI